MRGALNRGVAMVAALFGPTPKPAPSTDSLNEGARQYRLAKAVAEAQERGLEVGDDSAIAVIATKYLVAPTDIMAQLPNRIGEALDYCERPEVQAKLSESAHDPEALARLLAGRTVAEGEMDGRYAAACPPFPPIETPSGSVPLDVPGAPVVATPEGDRGPSPNAIRAEAPTLSLKGDVKLLHSGRVGCSRCGNAADNLQTLLHGAGCTHAQLSALAGGVGLTAGAPPRPLGTLETEAQRRTRLLAEWEAHRAAEPMAAGRVPGEPMPRTEAELIDQAWRVLGIPDYEDAPEKWCLPTMRLLFSMALTYCRFERRHFYEEHDGNRLVASMVRSARGMA